MITNDSAILYETKKYQVEKAIDALEEINLNVTDFRKELEEIDSNCQKEVDKYSSASFSGFLENAYIQGMSKLDSLYFKLKKYKVYTQPHFLNNQLREKLNYGIMSEEDLIVARNQIIKFLNDIKNSSTIDYSITGPIIEEIYNLTLSFIELETNMFGSSMLLSLLSMDEIHHFNLDKAITHRLEKMDLRNPEYQDLKAKKEEIDENGIDNTYLTQDFIKLLAYADLSNSQIVNEIKDVLSTLITYENQIRFVKTDIKKDKSHILGLREFKLINSCKYFIKAMSYYGVIAGLLTGFFFFAGKCSISKTYKHNVARYSQGKWIPEETYYSKFNESKVLVYEYSPYSKTEDGEYKRKITCYKLYEMDKNIEDYLAADYTNCFGEEYEETKPSLSMEDQYTESYLEVVKTKMNPEVFKPKFDFVNLVFYTIISSIIIGVAYLVIELILYCLYDESLKHDIKYDLNKLKRNILNINENLKDAKVSLAGNEKELLKLKQTSLEIIKQAERTLKLIDGIPNLGYYPDDLRNSIKRVRELTK